MSDCTYVNVLSGLIGQFVTQKILKNQKHEDLN